MSRWYPDPRECQSHNDWTVFMTRQFSFVSFFLSESYHSALWLFEIITLLWWKWYLRFYYMLFHHNLRSCMAYFTYRCFSWCTFLSWAFHYEIGVIIYSGFWLIVPLFNLGSCLFGANPDGQECTRNSLHLFVTPCHLTVPVAAIWHTCDCYVISESLTQYKWTPSYRCSLRLAVTLIVCALWCVQKFFHLKG
jgi:hypothetical protein